MDIGFILTKLMMMFAAVIAAFIAVKCGKWDTKGNHVLSNAVTYVLNPATIIASAISGERLLTNSQVLTLTGIACACYAFLILTAYLVPIILRVPRDKNRLYRFMYIFSNINFFGLPIVRALFGESAAFLVVIYVMFFQLLLFTYGITLIAGDAAHRKFNLKMLLHPMVISCALAYILYLAKVQLPAVIKEPLAFIGQATSPIAMMVVGGSLAYAPLKKVFLNWRLYAMSFLKMVVVPVIVLVVLRNILPQTEANVLIIGVSVIVMAMPTAAATTILANQYGGDVNTTTSAVCLSTILSIATIPLLMWLLTVV